jgi:succinyl-CoA synthetase beta subunit
MLAELRQPSHEYYVAVLNDRASEGVVLVASNQGGMNIEEVAAKDPNAIISTPIPFATGLTKETAVGVAKKLGFSSEKATNEAADIFINLYKIFKEKDATQIEINPLAETTDGAVLWSVHIRNTGKARFLFYCLTLSPCSMDAKFGFDDNAEFRQKDIFDLRDISQEEPSEVEAQKANLNFIKLDGNIGCLVNGAGLAMATMDVLSLHGGQPANFLDVGGYAVRSRFISVSGSIHTIYHHAEVRRPRR